METNTIILRYSESKEDTEEIIKEKVQSDARKFKDFHLDHVARNDSGEWSITLKKNKTFEEIFKKE